MCIRKKTRNEWNHTDTLCGAFERRDYLRKILSQLFYSILSREKKVKVEKERALWRGHCVVGRVQRQFFGRVLKSQPKK